MTEAMTPAEERAILEDLERIQSEPPPTDPAAVGCIAALVALAALIALPFISDWLPFGSRTIRLIAIGLSVVLVFGTLLRIVGVGLIRSDVDESIETLRTQFPGRDEPVRREAALRILTGAYYSGGPWTVGTFDTDDVARRLGHALPYVVRIERFLLERELIYAVFTQGDKFRLRGPSA